MSKVIATAFDTRLRQLQTKGHLTHEDLGCLYPPKTKLTTTSPVVPSLEQVEYYGDFTIDPKVMNDYYQGVRDEAQQVLGEVYMKAILRSNQHHQYRKYRQYDFRLTEDETTRLQQHGLMVSERLGAKSFASIYYRLYSDDLPVFVTSDSVLHAWHQSFDAFLTDLEMQELMPLLGTTLVKILDSCAIEYDAAMAAGNTVAQAALAEVELFVMVAHRLLLQKEPKAPVVLDPLEQEHPYYIELRQRRAAAEEAYEASLGKLTSLHIASNNNTLEMLLEMAKREQRASVVILGSERDVDFSLFKPRGHYVKSDKLKRFFRAMSWLGTVDFRIDGSAPGDEAAQVQDRYQLQCACMAIHVLRKANAFEALRTFHETISALAGDGVGADSMTPMQLDTLIGQRDILKTYFGDMAIENFASLQEEIANQGLGAQAIMGHPFMEASSTKPTRPPTAFAFMGQQFVWSAFVFSKLVFDQVSHQGIKIPRRMTSGVDVAFALFGNDIATSEITKRMTASPGGDSDFVEFRDGLPYTANLIATRQVIEDHLAKVDPEKTSIAMLWQLALRELSKSSASQDKVFTSDVWQKRLMNTQLASFTQLRHDTILYAKQSSGAMTCCEYPAGYVDPYPSFWVKMKELSQRMLAIVETIQITKGITTEENESYMQRKARNCFQSFVNITDQLVKISMAQAQHQDLTEEQVHFLKTVMEERHGSGGTRYLGWYPSLFYVEREQSGKRDHLVADVHTDPPSLEHGDVGGVLHMGVGDVNLAMVVAGNTLYAGPVFSHYELVTPFNERLTDTDFSARLPSLQAPQWARESFLATN